MLLVGPVHFSMSSHRLESAILSPKPAGGDSSSSLSSPEDKPLSMTLCTLIMFIIVIIDCV